MIPAVAVAKKTVLRVSARSEILWHMHVVLDSVEEEPQAREKFVSRMLREMGISPGRRAKLTALVCAKLPQNLNETDMGDVLAVFEEVLPIEWHDDLTTVSIEAATSFKRALLQVFAARKPGELPRQVTAQILDELERAVGPALDQTLLPQARESIENRLVSELWRCKDLPSQRDLAAWVVHDLKRLLRLDLGGLESEKE